MGMKQEIRAELTGHILPFWLGLQDQENGGFYGFVSYEREIERRAPKGSILQSRILWTFSAASLALRDPALLAAARHAWEFVQSRCVDETDGGVYGSVTAKGAPLDTTKHTYAQAFALYGVSAYYRAGKDPAALRLACRLREQMEQKCRDADGYGEAFTRSWRPARNDKLSENGTQAARTMNTLLHVFEAYAGFYEATKDESTARSLRWILELFCDKIYNPALRRQEVFFDAGYRSLIDLHSYGHDIEAAWLLDWGCGLLGDAALSARVRTVTNALALEVLHDAYHGHALYNECEKGVEDRTQVWWVQAEAVTGFVNAWQKTQDTAYLCAAQELWEHIRTRLVDSRPGGEWYWALTPEGEPVAGRPIVEPWKCPYHNARMCMEMLRRLPEDE